MMLGRGQYPPASYALTAIYTLMGEILSEEIFVYETIASYIC